MLKDEKWQSYIEFDASQSADTQVLKKVLIDWLFEVGERFRQSNLTIHIAIAYLERCF